MGIKDNQSPQQKSFLLSFTHSVIQSVKVGAERPGDSEERKIKIEGIDIPSLTMHTTHGELVAGFHRLKSLSPSTSDSGV